MPYIIHSPFHDGFAKLSRRFEQWLFIYWIVRWIGIFLAWLAYLGEIFASLFFVLPPFMLFRHWNIHPPNLMYWILASLVVAGLVFGFLWGIRTLIRSLRQYIVDLDLMALNIGLGLALFFALYIFPNGLSDSS